MHLGQFYLDDAVVFTATTTSSTGGGAVDADAEPTYRIYEDENGTAIATGTMSKLDDTNTTGFYSEQVQIYAVNGYEYGKTYTIYIEGVVGGVTGTCNLMFTVKSQAEHNIKLAGLRIVAGTVDSTAVVPTTTTFEADDITEATADHYKYRWVMFTSGVLANQTRDISAYSLNGGRGAFVVTAFTEAPANDDTFVLI